MAMLVVAAAASWVGSAIGGALGYAALGSSIGWAVGSMLYSASQTEHIGGARSDDLSSPKLQYGSRIPRMYGRQRIAGIPVWFSDKRANKNTTSEGGKGGPKVETTTYTYEIDALFLVAIESEVIAVTRVWVNRQLVYSVLAESDNETIQTSLDSESWDSITLFDGNPAQMPWAIYEAAVGTANAIAFRRRTTIGIAALNLGSSDQVPLIEFEIITRGTSENFASSVLFQTCFREGSTEDESLYEVPTSLGNDCFIYEEPEDDFYLKASGPNIVTSTGLTASVSIDPTLGVTISCWVRWWSLNNLEGHDVWFWGNSGFADFHVYLLGHTDAPAEIIITGTGFGFRQFGTVGVGGWTHLRLVMPGSSPGDPAVQVRFYIDGVQADSFPYASSSFTGGPLDILGFNTNAIYEYDCDDFQIQVGEVNTANFVPPPRPLPLPGDAGLIWTPEPHPLDEIVAAEVDLAGLDASRYDVADLAVEEVVGFAAMGSGRATIEDLMAGYYFEACCSDKLYFRFRGRAIADTIEYGDLAAGNDESTRDAFDPVRANLEELPAQVALGYSNISADYESGQEMGDRLVGPGREVRTLQLPLVLTPAEAKGRALAMVMDALASGTSARISVTDEYCELEPTDAIVVPDVGGTLRRMRIVRETYARGVKQLELVGDDPTALVTSGLTMDESVPVISVPAPRNTYVDLLDIPLLKDAYDVPGFMAAFYPDVPAGWPGAALFRSLDGSSYEQVATATDRATRGTATELGDWTEEGRKFDERNTVTVTVDNTLSSATRDTLSEDRELNVAAIGADGRWEIIRFRTAALVSPGVYTLSGLMRGCLGTEWAAGLHEAGDIFVLLQPAGLRRVNHTTGDIGLERFYKAVTLGRSLGTADAQAFTDTGVNLKPLSPVDARGSRSGDDLTLTWRRRTRYTTRHFGPLAESVPLGEAAELYSVDIIDTGVVVGTVATTSPSVTFDVTDFGLTPGDPVDVAVYQISASVGRGYPLEATV